MGIERDGSELSSNRKMKGSGSGSLFIDGRLPGSTRDSELLWYLPREVPRVGTL